MKKKHLILAALCLCLVSAVWPLAAGQTTKPQIKDTHFYFVQITDTHLDQADHVQRTARVIEAINNLPMNIECVVHTGDIITSRIENTESVGKNLALLARLKPPVHYISGTHDILRRKDKLQTTAKMYHNRYGPLCHQAEYDGVVFLFVCTEPLAKQFTLKGFDPLVWLEQALKQAGDKPVIVFHHTPSVEDFYKNTMHHGWPEDARNKWIALLNTHNVKAVIAGHFHRDEHHWLGNVPLYVSAPVAGFWSRQATFRIFEYHNGKLGYRTQYIE